MGKTIRIRGLPISVRCGLEARAKAAGVPLEDYLRQQLIVLARQRPVDEIVEEWLSSLNAKPE